MHWLSPTANNGLPSRCGEQSYSPAAVCRLLIVGLLSLRAQGRSEDAQASAAATQWVQSTGSAAVAHGLRYSMAVGSSGPGIKPAFSCSGRWILYRGATRKARRESLVTMMLEHLDHPHAKNQSRHIFHKIQSKRILNLSVKCKTIKPTE